MKKILLILAVFSLLYGTGETWTRLTPSGSAPSIRWGAASVYDSANDRFIVFGGARGFSAAYNDLYALDGTATGNGTWTRLTPTGSIPGVRGFCAPVYDEPRRRMIIFGGYNMAGSCDNRVYFLDNVHTATPQWSFITFSGSQPIYRQSAAAAYDPIQERVIVFSGWCGYAWRNDVWLMENLDGTPTWRQIYPTGGGPGGRWGASCVYDYNNDRLYVFGGMSASQTYPNNVWALEGLQTGDGNWVNISAGGSIPPGRMWLVSAYDEPEDRMLMFSGGYFQGSTYNDLRSLGPLSGSPSWTSISASGTTPTSRLGCSYALDPANRRLIVFGGYSGANYNDTYTLTWDAGAFEDESSSVNRTLVTIEPNPFSNHTTISFESGKEHVSSVTIFDCQGRQVNEYLLKNRQIPFKVMWDGKDENGFTVSSGTYFMVIETNEAKIVKTVVKIQ